MRSLARTTNRWPRYATTIVVLLAAACGGDPDDEGDGGSTSSGTGGTNSTTTTTTSTGAGGTTAGCAAHWDCGADEVCINGGCDLAWGRVFRFTAVSATIPGSDPSTGDAWDPFGGAPDPFVQMFAGTSAEEFTSVVMDTFAPVWNHSVNVVLAQDAIDLEFYVWDDDPVDDPDYVTGAAGSPVQWLAVVREPASAGMLTVSDPNGTSFTVSVAPQ